MSAMPKMTASDKKWQAEQDARTLVLAEEIKLDKARKSAAQREVNKQFKAVKKAATRKR